MEMKRYVRHSPGWWIAAVVCFIAAAVFTVLLCFDREARSQAQPQTMEDTLYLDGFYTVDVQYVTSWVYRMDYEDGSHDTFYLSQDKNLYSYILQMDEDTYARLSDIAAYTASDSCDLYAADEPLTLAPAEGEENAPAVAKPAPVRLNGILRPLPENVATAMAEWSGYSDDEFQRYYGTYYLDLTMTPADLENPWLVPAVLSALYALCFASAAITCAVQYRKTRRRLQVQGLYDRAQSEFHYLQGDPKAAAQVSTAFVYGRHNNVMVPLSDVAWVYRTEIRFLLAKQITVALLTEDGRAFYLKMSRKDTARTANAIVSAVSARNPDALVGLTRENQQLYAHQVPKASQLIIRPWLSFVLGIVLFVILRLILDLVL